jgi:hypothetical protein
MRSRDLDGGSPDPVVLTLEVTPVPLLALTWIEPPPKPLALLYLSIFAQRPSLNLFRIW